jgi:hypothetical protein
VEEIEIETRLSLVPIRFPHPGHRYFNGGIHNFPQLPSPKIRLRITSLRSTTNNERPANATGTKAHSQTNKPTMLSFTFLIFGLTAFTATVLGIEVSRHLLPTSAPVKRAYHVRTRGRGMT